MAKETQKEKIERLENELSKAQEIIQKLNNEIDVMIDKADDSFENSCTYRQMEKQIDTLELKVKTIASTSEHNRKMYTEEIKTNEKLNNYIQELKNENKQLKNSNFIHKLKNERGAGRKARFTDEQIENIKKHRSSGKTIKEIAEIFNCSVGLIHKLINE